MEKSVESNDLNGEIRGEDVEMSSPVSNQGPLGCRSNDSPAELPEISFESDNHSHNCQTNQLNQNGSSEPIVSPRYGADAEALSSPASGTGCLIPNPGVEGGSNGDKSRACPGRHQSPGPSRRERDPTEEGSDTAEVSESRLRGRCEKPISVDQGNLAPPDRSASRSLEGFEGSLCGNTLSESASREAPSALGDVHVAASPTGIWLLPSSREHHLDSSAKGSKKSGCNSSDPKRGESVTDGSPVPALGGLTRTLSTSFAARAKSKKKTSLLDVIRSGDEIRRDNLNNDTPTVKVELPKPNPVKIDEILSHYEAGSDCNTMLRITEEARPFQLPRAQYETVIETGLDFVDTPPTRILQSFLTGHGNPLVASLLESKEIGQIHKRPFGNLSLKVKTKTIRNTLGGQTVTILGKKYKIREFDVLEDFFYIDIAGVDSACDTDGLFRYFFDLGCKPIYTTNREVNISTETTTAAWRVYFASTTCPEPLMVKGAVCDQLLFNGRVHYVRPKQIWTKGSAPTRRKLSPHCLNVDEEESNQEPPAVPSMHTGVREEGRREKTPTFGDVVRRNAKANVARNQPEERGVLEGGGVSTLGEGMEMCDIDIHVPEVEPTRVSTMSKNSISHHLHTLPHTNNTNHHNTRASAASEGQIVLVEQRESVQEKGGEATPENKEKQRVPPQQTQTQKQTLQTERRETRAQKKAREERERAQAAHKHHTNNTNPTGETGECAEVECGGASESERVCESERVSEASDQQGERVPAGEVTDGVEDGVEGVGCESVSVSGRALCVSGGENTHSPTHTHTHTLHTPPRTESVFTTVVASKRKRQPNAYSPPQQEKRIQLGDVMSLDTWCTSNYYEALSAIEAEFECPVWENDTQGEFRYQIVPSSVRAPQDTSLRKERSHHVKKTKHRIHKSTGTISIDGWLEEMRMDITKSEINIAVEKQTSANHFVSSAHEKLTSATNVEDIVFSAIVHPLAYTSAVSRLMRENSIALEEVAEMLVWNKTLQASNPNEDGRFLKLFDSLITGTLPTDRPHLFALIREHVEIDQGADALWEEAVALSLFEFAMLCAAPTLFRHDYWVEFLTGERVYWVPGYHTRFLPCSTLIKLLRGQVGKHILPRWEELGWSSAMFSTLQRLQHDTHNIETWTPQLHIIDGKPTVVAGPLACSY